MNRTEIKLTDVTPEFKLLPQEVIAELRKIHDMLYKEFARIRRKRAFKMQRPSEIAMTEAHWHRQLVAISTAIKKLESL